MIDNDIEGNTESSLMLDQAGFAHISYTKSRYRGSELMYAYQDLSGWQINNVRSSTTSATPSMDLDMLGKPHISYAGEYIYLDDSEWQSQTTDSECVVYTSLSLDNAGKPHIICLSNYPEAGLRYSYQQAGDWHTLTLDRANYVIADNSLALDQFGHPHISFYLNERDLKYASLEGSDWSSQLVDSGQALFGSTNIEFDRMGYPHLSYFVSGMDQSYLNYASLENSQWLPQTAVRDLEIEPYHSMALDRDGNPHISFQQSPEIKYTSLDKSSWISQTVVSGIDLDNSALSMSIDSAGYPHISYHNNDYENESSALIYTYLDGSGWNSQTVDSDNVWNVGVGVQSSLAIDANGQPHVAYLTNHINDQSFGDGIPVYRLNYATLDPTGWQTQTVDDAGSSPISLALDIQGRPHISFQGMYPKYDLKYATLNSSGWYTESIYNYSSAFTGSSSLTLDEDGYPHISFNSYGDLLYAYLAPPYRGTLWPNVNQHYALPGSTVIYALQVTNRGLEQDTYKVSVIGAGWLTTATESLGPLDNAESITLNIQVTIPPTASLGSSDTATITLTSQSDPSFTASATLTTYATITTYLPMVAR